MLAADCVAADSCHADLSSSALLQWAVILLCTQVEGAPWLHPLTADLVHACTVGLASGAVASWAPPALRALANLAALSPSQPLMDDVQLTTLLPVLEAYQKHPEVTQPQQIGLSCWRSVPAAACALDGFTWGGLLLCKAAPASGYLQCCLSVRAVPPAVHCRLHPARRLWHLPSSGAPWCPLPSSRQC